ncbi:FtsX-like permease family protein [Enterocloster citroniae]|uniref:FtsX-like permease family protein n=1 Tax=Enterocloster citroniae TaxID=358743 RepID=UPI0032C1ED14
MIEVYYVEDDEFIGNTVKEYLEEQSFHVLIYTTVEAARQALMKHVPSNGADDYVVKPFDLDVLYSRICIPLSLWKEISGDIEGTQQDTWIRILSEEGASLEELDALEEDVLCLLGGIYDIEIENRIQEKITNDIMIFGYQLVIGGLCFILALIGIANVFSNTLGFLRQRKREFAQYLSIGMTPAGIRKIFCIEAAVIAGRPILITIPLTVAAVGVMIKASYLDPMEFIAKAPVGPILAFCLIMAGFVALAYYLGGKKVMKCSLSEALRDDTLE